MSVPLTAAALCALILAAIPPFQAGAQAVPAATWPIGNTNPGEQPLPGQTLGTDLTLNQGVEATSAENESFNRFGLGFEASGGAITNFFGTQTNPTTATYAQFSATGGILLRTSRTRYFVLYQPQYTVYPQYSEVNTFAQSFYQTLTKAFTERAGIEWDTTAARYLSLNEYLPQSLAIGGIGIIVPTLGQQLQQNSFEVTNAATSLRFRYLINTRMTFNGTLTGGYFLIVPDVAGELTNSTERFLTGGADLRLDYQLTPRDTIGAEATPIYLYGLTPTGHEIAETVQGIYERQLTATLTARVGAGPLFVQSSFPATGSFQATSYAVNAGVSRQVRQSQFSGSYSRAFVVNFLAPAVIANQFGFNAYSPVRSHWILVGNATYAHDSGSSLVEAETVYGGSAQLSYQVASKVQFFARYSVISQNFGSAALAQQADNFTRNQFGGGIRFNLGNPVTRGINPGGAQ